MNKALLIIDWEKEWINTKSEYYIGSDLSSETKKINKLIKFARLNQYKVIFVKHIDLDSDSFKDNDLSTEFIDNLDFNDKDFVIKKNKISSFYKTNLEDVLVGVDSIIVAGILTNLCVRSAIQDAYDRGFEITVVNDCCVALNKNVQEFTLKDLKQTRPEIKIVTLDNLININ